MTHPGSSEPHVTEGVCTCPHHGPYLMGHSLNCGLSSHRVRAAAARTVQHETKETR